MGYWKSKVLPKLKKLLKKGPKGQKAADACRSFNKTKDSIAQEIDENKEALQPKVSAIYRSSNNDAKGLLKSPTETGISESIEAVQNLLNELSDAGCPGAQTLRNAATNHGPGAMAGPITFLLSKLTVFVASEEDPAATPEPTKSEQRELLEIAPRQDEQVIEPAKSEQSKLESALEEPVHATIPKPTVPAAAPLP